MKSQKVSTNMVMREKNDSGLNLCINRVKVLLIIYQLCLLFDCLFNMKVKIIIITKFHYDLWTDIYDSKRFKCSFLVHDGFICLYYN